MSIERTIIFITLWRKATDSEPIRKATADEILVHLRLVDSGHPYGPYITCDTGYYIEVDQL